MLRTSLRSYIHLQYCKLRGLSPSRVVCGSLARALKIRQRFFSLGLAQQSDSDNKDKDFVISSLVQPIPVKPFTDPGGINIGQELTGKEINKSKFLFFFPRLSLIAANPLNCLLPLRGGH